MPKRRSHHRRGSSRPGDELAASRSSAERLFQTGLDQHRRGDLAAATESYGQLVRQQPHHAHAWHMLGFARLQQGRFSAAVEAIQQAVDLQPGEGEFHHNLGLCCLAAGRLEQALSHAELACRAGYVDPHSWHQLAWEMVHRGQLQAAEPAVRLALGLDPNNPELHHTLGVILKQRGQMSDAATCFERALALQPNFFEALVNLANVYRDRGQHERALSYYRTALGQKPDSAPTYNHLGMAYQRLLQYAQARNCFCEASRLEPESAEPLNNLGVLSRIEGHLSEALEYLLSASHRAPQVPEIQNNLGMVYRDMGQYEQAESCFRKALAQRSQSPEIVSNLAATLLEQGQYDQAAQLYRQADGWDSADRGWQLRAAMVCPSTFPDREAAEATWQRLQSAVRDHRRLELSSSLDDIVHIAGQPPFAAQFFPVDLRPFKEAYAAIFGSIAERAAEPPPPSARGPHRIGVLVTSRHEGVFLKSMADVFARLDRQRFSVCVFAAPAAHARLATALPGVELQPLPDQLSCAAAAIRAARVDLLYYWEVGTDALNYFLPFLRPAAIQCTSWGIQVTSGIPQMDYYLSSSLVEPPSATEHYSEKLLLAETLLCRRRLACEAGGKQRSDFALDRQDHVYACPQQPGKLHPDFDLWLAGILERDPQARVVLTGRDSAPGRIVQQRITTRFPRFAHRMLFLPRLPHSDYLALIRNSDVLLDPPYFGGVNTTYDSLAAGKPIVTCPGRFHRSRYTWGCYRKLGVETCVARDASQYVDLACRLGTDAELRRHVEQQILAARHLLFEDDGAVQEHERLFEQMIRMYGS